jgi:hypothetical protein
MIRLMLSVVVCLVLTSCGKTGAPSTISVKATGVRLTAFKIEAGKASEPELRRGLQAAADALSMVYAESRKTYPQLKGHLRGTFHIEPDGTPRMFIERGSEFTPVEGKGVSDDFVGATFGGKWRFPRVGADLMVTIDYELEPGS